MGIFIAADSVQASVTGGHYWRRIVVGDLTVRYIVDTAVHRARCTCRVFPVDINAKP